MVGGFVQQQHVGLLQQQAAQGHAALLAAREVADDGFLGRGAQGVHGALQLGVEVPGVELVEALLHGALALQQLVEVGILGPEGFVDFVVFLQQATVSAAPSSTTSRTVLVGSSWGSCSR